MIIPVRGDIMASPVQTLVCPVNTVGVMGKGLAELFKLKWLDMFYEYKQLCRRQYFVHNRNLCIKVPESRQVLCLPTKQHWRYPSKIEWIEAALKDLEENYASKYNITEMAIPAIGCGEGGLPWEEVKLLIFKYLGKLPIKVHLYFPDWVEVEEFDNLPF